MTSVVVLKLNGWPETFDERVSAIARHVDLVTVVRPAPRDGNRDIQANNVTTYNLLPARGSYVKPAWLKPMIFLVHVIQAILVLSYLVAIRNRRPDAIHALDYALGGFAGAVVAKLFSVPLVVSVRGLKEPRYRSLAEDRKTMRARLQYRILRWITQFALIEADHVVTKAPYQVNFVRETFGVTPGFSTIPTGVDFDIFDPKTVEEDDPLRQLLVDAGYRVETDEKLVLYLAKLVPEKGPDQVLSLLTEASSAVPDDVVFVFIGEFRDSTYKRRFRTAMEDVDTRVYLHPERVPFDDVPGLLSDANAVVLLSESGTEGAPRILQEACALGTPIVASNVDGISGAFEDLTSCYLIDRSDPEEFVNAVTAAVNDPGDLSRDIVAERFDLYQNYSKYACIYDRLGTDHSE